MTTQLSPELEQFVESEVAAGRFTDRTEVLEQALRLLQRDREEAVAGIQAGLADVAAGNTQPLGDAFRELRSELGMSDAP